MLNSKYATKLADSIVGYSKANLNNDQFGQHLIRETQKVKVHQSQNVLPILLIQGAIYLFFLWDEAPRFNLVFWLLSVILTGLYRSYICKKIEKILNTTNVKTLYYNELWLFFSGLGNNLIVGTGFWWIGINGTDKAVFAITLINCIYAIGATINSSVKFNGFTLLIITNLGQGILFFSGAGRTPDPIFSVGLIGICIVLIQFGKKNAAIFSESIRIRDEIRQKNLKLEQDKKIIASALTAAKEANEDKSRFLAAASHDLRQPLHAMTLFIACLRQTVNEPNSIEIIDKIEETSNTLSDQFNSLLDLSKFDTGVVKTNITRFHFHILLHSIIEGVREEAKNKNLTLILETDPVSVTSDTLLTERLVRNIILNAIHYTEQGTVLVKTKIVKTGVHLIVNDTGVGISKLDQKKIFDDFYQTNNPSRSSNKGTGLGLAIVKRISELLGLEIKLESKLGQGTTFNVFFPQREEKTHYSKNEKMKNTENKIDFSFEKLNILLVDDDPNILQALSRLIETWNCTPLIATSLAEVIDIINANHTIDFAIIDDMLGINETGLEIAEFLSTKIKHQPIIVSGNVLPERILEIKNHGFMIYQKPIDAKKLHLEISKILTHS